MTLVHLSKKLLRSVASSIARATVSRLAPGQPRLTGDEWLYCQFSFAQLGEDYLA